MCAWQGGACDSGGHAWMGGMHGGVHAWQVEAVCMAGGHAWWGCAWQEIMHEGHVCMSRGMLCGGIMHGEPVFGRGLHVWWGVHGGTCRRDGH